MSTLTVDEMIRAVPAGFEVCLGVQPARRPRTASNVIALPARGVALPAPAPARGAVAAAGVALTPRGLAVVVTFFLALFVTAAVVLVTGFLAFSNEPLVTAQVSGPAQVGS